MTQEGIIHPINPILILVVAPFRGMNAFLIF